MVALGVRAFGTVCRDPQEVVRRLPKNTRPGAVILMHEGVESKDGSRQAPQVLLGPLGSLDRRGLRAVLPDAPA